MIKAIAIDDEPPALAIIKSFCAQVDFIQLLASFSKPAEALQFIRENEVDLLFIDINMPSLSGIDLYRHVKNNTMAIFTTAFSHYAVEGFNLAAVDYLLKPFTLERFIQAVKRAKEFHERSNKGESSLNKFIFIRADYSLVRIELSEILYIETLDDYLKIHLQKQRPIVARLTLKAMMEKLPAEEFARVHRSYIIALHRVENIRNKVIQLEGVEIPIGSSYEESFFKNFNK